MTVTGYNRVQVKGTNDDGPSCNRLMSFSNISHLEQMSRLLRVEHRTRW